MKDDHGYRPCSLASFPNHCNLQQRRACIRYSRMFFAPVEGPALSSSAFVRSSVFDCFIPLAALCSSLLAAILAFIDNLATRIPPSFCIVCQIKRLRESFASVENKTTALVFDPGTDVYSLKRLEEIDGKSVMLLVYPPTTRAHSEDSRESHLPQHPPQLSPTHQSPAPWRNKMPCRSPCRRHAQQAQTEPSTFAGRWVLHHAGEGWNPNDTGPKRHK